MQCSAVRYSASPYSAVRCGAVRCGAVRCGAVRCGAVRCGAVRCGSLRKKAARQARTPAPPAAVPPGPAATPGAPCPPGAAPQTLRPPPCLPRRPHCAGVATQRTPPGAGRARRRPARLCPGGTVGRGWGHGARRRGPAAHGGRGWLPCPLRGGAVGRTRGKTGEGQAAQWRRLCEGVAPRSGNREGGGDAVHTASPPRHPHLETQKTGDERPPGTPRHT
jgi:hypothetical protein